jgi:hypothetical protein
MSSAILARPSYMPKCWPLPSSCVLYLEGQQDPQSSTIRDLSGYGNHGTITGCTWTRTGQGLWYQNYAGGDDSIRITDAANLDIVNAITLEAWVKPGLADTEQYLIAKGDRGVAVNYILSITASNYLAFEFYTAPTWYTDADNTTLLSVGAWYHLMATYDKTNVKLYVNGALKRTIARTPVLTVNALDLYIGREESAGGTFFTGDMDLYRIYNQALPQMADHYSQERYLFGV